MWVIDQLKIFPPCRFFQPGSVHHLLSHFPNWHALVHSTVPSSHRSLRPSSHRVPLLKPLNWFRANRAPFRSVLVLVDCLKVTAVKNCLHWRCPSFLPHRHNQCGAIQAKKIQVNKLDGDLILVNVCEFYKKAILSCDFLKSISVQLVILITWPFS